MSLQIRPLSYALGAEISGVDIRKPLDDKSFREIHAAFLEYSVLLFRGLPLTREQHVAFSRRFGKVDADEALVVGGDPKYPEIYVNRPEPNSKPIDYVGEAWHTDQPYRLIPTMASLLRSVEIPEVGGDTLFANMHLAYETLSDGMKKLIEGLDAVHFKSITPKTRVKIGGTGRYDYSTPERAAATKRLNPPVAQPLVRVHPETGRKALYLTFKVKQLVGMSAEESEPLIQFLYNHATRPQFVYRHRWRKDDLLVWDDRCTMHKAVGDYDRTQIRHLERTIVAGTPSGYIYEGPLQ